MSEKFSLEEFKENLKKTKKLYKDYKLSENEYYYFIAIINKKEIQDLLKGKMECYS